MRPGVFCCIGHESVLSESYNEIAFLEHERGNDRPVNELMRQPKIHRVTDPERLTSFQTPLKQAGVLISRLLQRIATKARGAILLGVIRESASLRFACECARRLRTFPDSKREPILALAEEAAMLSLLGKRIEEHCNILPEPIYLLEPETAGTYLLNWELSCEPNAPRDYLSAHIRNRPETATLLMKCFLPNGWGMTTGLPIETDFDRSTYDVLSRVVPPETVAEVLRSIYGDLLKTLNLILGILDGRARVSGPGTKRNSEDWAWLPAEPCAGSRLHRVEEARKLAGRSLPGREIVCSVKPRSLQSHGM